jgi:hypothetical protein
VCPYNQRTGVVIALTVRLKRLMDVIPKYELFGF